MLPVSRRAALGGALAGLGVVAGERLARAAVPVDDTSIGDAPLFRDPDAPVLGNPQGSLPMAEFFDYRCPYCQQMHPLVRRLLQADSDIRYVAKEWPVFGGVSVVAARAALAANWQGKFAAVNSALFRAAGGLDAARVRDALKDAGVDMARFDHDLAARRDDLNASLGRVAMQAGSLGLQGTPVFVIGTYVVPGALSYDDLRKVVAKARAKLQSSDGAKPGAVHSPI